MDPVTLAAVLIAVVTGASEALGDQLLTGLASLVRRPWHRKTPTADPAALPPGEAELTALQQSPRDQQKAVRWRRCCWPGADADAGFGRALQEWWEHAEPVRVSSATSRTRSAAAPSTGRCCRAGTLLISPSARPRATAADSTAEGSGPSQ